MTHKEYMAMAIEVALKSVAEPGKDRPTPLVGAVLVKDGQVLGTAHRGQTGDGDHAEYGLIKNVVTDRQVTKGADLFVTLEPCTVRGVGKTPCARHVLDAGIRRVVVGMLDPNRDIQGDGYWTLTEHGVEVSFFTPELAKRVREANAEFIADHRPRRWAPPPQLRGLDDWYHAINGVYLDRNFDRDVTWVFAHLVEVIGGLSFLTTGKEKAGVTADAFLAKAIAWWFALCGAVGLRSVEDMLWLKFPGVCSYCHQNPHRQRTCTAKKRESKSPHWDTLRKLARSSAASRPSTPNDWKTMFGEIYEVQQVEEYHVTFGRLCEELGELSECVRVISVLPSSFLSEAADVFAWLMHLCNLLEFKQRRDLDLNALLWDRYPDRCRECNSTICSCPPFISKTLRRIAHEGPPFLLDSETNAFVSSTDRLSLFDVGSKKVEIGSWSAEVSPELLEELHAWGKKTLEHIRADESPLVMRLYQRCMAISRMAATQRASQLEIDRVVWLLRGSADEELPRLRAILEGGPSGAFRDALVKVTDEELARRGDAE